MAEWAILVGPAVLAILWLSGGEADRAAAVAAGVAASVALGLAAALSQVIDVPRPFMDAGAVNYLGHVRDSSFPSDHATLAFALAAGLWWRRPPKLPRVWIPLLILAVAIGWARVSLGTHYPSDIAGGALLGAAAVAATATPPGRAAIRVVDAIGERLRDLALAIWRRFGPDDQSSGVSDP